METKTIEERIYIFYKKLDNKLSFYKKIAIENIQNDVKNDKITVKKDEYLELLNAYHDLFEDIIRDEFCKKLNETIDNTFELEDVDSEI